MKLARVGTFLAWLALLTCFAAVASVACEAIVPNDVPTPPCSMTPFVDPGNGTCPRGMFCGEGARCTPCQAKDICDGYDNDCDGLIDDGPYSDKDGDGYTKCGKGIDPNTGLPLLRDCDDTSKTIYPGAPEICNGKDDNCDGIVDNPNLVCPPGETCVPQTGQCISNAATCVECADAAPTPGCCQSPNTCDKGTQACVPNGTQDAGTSCSGDKACSTGICSDPAELGPGQTIATCTKPCCTSDDCDPGSVCWGAGTGGNYCLPGSAVGRPALGRGEPGTLCTDNSLCRSGVCAGGRCEDTCCSNSNCLNGTVCAYATLGGAGTLACTLPPGTTATNKQCSRNAQCASGFCACYSTDNADDCHPSPNGNAIQLCAQPCCSSRQCGVVGVNQLLCNNDFLPPAQSGSLVSVCDAVQAETPTGTPAGNPVGNVGDACTTFTDCFSNLCGVPTAPASCTDVCCVDTDCARAGWVCRPTPTGTGTFLRCVPQPT